jgi:flagellar motor switch protein FliG
VVAPKEDFAMATIPNATPDAIKAMSEQLSRALGEAVVRIWSHLPQEIQHNLFEEAIASQGVEQAPQTRSQLATFLHDKHPRTCASIKANAMIEPDSLGG